MSRLTSTNFAIATITVALLGVVWVCGTAGLRMGTDISIPSPIEFHSPARSELAPVAVTTDESSSTLLTPNGESPAPKTPLTKPRRIHNSSPPEKPVVRIRTGTICGRITFDGTPPEHELMFEGLPPVDSAVCGRIEHYDESLLVNPLNNGIKNVFVFLSRRPKGELGTSVPAEAVRMTFRGCRLAPRCAVVQTGQEFQFHQDDPLPHNLDMSPATNANLIGSYSATPQGQAQEFYFRNPEPLPFRMTCAIHPWIRAWLLVTDHPFATVTDENGKFEVLNVPYGKHKFRIYHERAGQLERGLDVTVDCENVDLSELSFDASKFHD